MDRIVGDGVCFLAASRIVAQTLTNPIIALQPSTDSIALTSSSFFADVPQQIYSSPRQHLEH